MNLDDRMRSAHQRQLDDVSRAVDGASFTPTSSSPIRRAAPALALVAVVALAFVGARSLIIDDEAIVGTVDQPTEQTSPPTTGADIPADTSTSTTAATTTTAPPDERLVPETSVPEPVAPATTVAEAVATQPTVPETTNPPDSTAPPATEPAPTTTSTNPPAVATGVASAKCPSGFRAELENATLRYVTQNQGWGRLDDLVDEQDAEFEFEAWEPGFPDLVTVEVDLGELVSAVDIRVSQDPFTPVNGDIEIETFVGDELIESFTIALDGVDGWRDHTFTEPALLERFWITRRTETANITEVVVCVG